MKLFGNATINLILSVLLLAVVYPVRNYTWAVVLISLASVCLIIASVRQLKR